MRNDCATVDELLARGAGPRRDLARARAGRSTPASRSRRRGASPRRASRCSACASATRRWRRRSAARVVVGEPVHGKAAEVRHDGKLDLPRGREPADGGPLPLAGRRPRPARRARAVGRVARDRDGHPPPRAAGRGRAVPPRVGADRDAASGCCATSSTAQRLMPNDVVTEAIDAVASGRDLTRRAGAGGAGARSWPAPSARRRPPPS